MPDILIQKGEKIKSSRSGKELDCYFVASVYVGDIVVRYEYSFLGENKRRKTIKQQKLVEMLDGVWYKVVNF